MTESMWHHGSSQWTKTTANATFQQEDKSRGAWTVFADRLHVLGNKIISQFKSAVFAHKSLK